MSLHIALAVGAICWVGVAVVAVLHLASGDLLVPAVMGLGFAGWMALRRHELERVAAEV